LFVLAMADDESLLEFMITSLEFFLFLNQW